MMAPAKEELLSPSILKHPICTFALKIANATFLHQKEEIEEARLKANSH